MNSKSDSTCILKFWTGYFRNSFSILSLSIRYARKKIDTVLIYLNNILKSISNFWYFMSNFKTLFN